MKRKLLQSLLLTAMLLIGGNVWAGVNELYTQDFESFAVDANFNTVTGCWKFSDASVQKIVEAGGNKYLTFQSSTGSTRNAAINFNISNYTADNNWTVSFDFSLAPGNKDSGMFLGIVGANGTATAGNAWTASTGNVFSLVNSNASSSSYTVSVGGYTLDDALALTSGSFYNCVLNWDGTNINLTLTESGDSDPTLSTSKTYDNSLGSPKAIFWVTTRWKGTTNIDNIVVSQEVSSEIVGTPTISSAYAGANRTVTITGGTSTSGNDVTTYYTTDGTDPTSSSSVYSEALTITEDCTVKAISISSTSVASSIASLDVTVGQLTLATPTISASGFTNDYGVYVKNPTFSFACDNSAIEGTPAATLSYTFTPDGGSESAAVVGTSFTPSTKGTLKVIASADNYNSSEKSLVVSNGYTISFSGRDYSTASTSDISTNWGDAYDTEGWSGWASLTSYLSTSAVSNDEHLNIQNASTISLVIGWGWVRGDQKSYGYRVRYANEGDFIALKENSSKGSDATATTYQTVYCSEGSGAITNMASITVPATYAVQQLYHYTPASEVEIAIADCKQYETSEAFATAVAAESFSSAAQVYAFHTQWQIAQADAASSLDYTKVIRNAAVSDAAATDWAGAGTYSGEQYTGAPDIYFIDNNGANMWATQMIYGLPAGKYQVKVATRANADNYSHVYISYNDEYDICTARGTHVGNEGGELGNGWSWTYVPFEITETANIRLGFYKNSTNWAGCDDWHLYKVTEAYPVSVSSAGWATLYTPYALNFEGTGLTAYTATCDGSTVTLTEVTNIPAKTGVVLKGTENDYNIPLAASSSTAKGQLEGSVTWSVAYNSYDGYDLYMFALNDAKDAQFKKVTSGSIAAGKAYLPVAQGSGVKAFKVVINGTTTGVSEIKSQVEEGSNAIFNMAGQRVSRATKGLYIINGKKVLVK